MEDQKNGYMNIEVLGYSLWIFSQTNISTGGQIGQVTFCLYNKSLPFYTRENITGIDSFFLGSQERLGDKVSGRKIRPGRQVLELLAPPESWEEIAQLVQDLDPLKRRVVKNPLFNLKFIKDQSCNTV
jgi:hypothetical protein